MLDFSRGGTKTISLGGSDTFKRGEMFVSKFRVADAIGFRMRFSLTNASGGNAALTAAQVDSFLAGFDLTAAYGPNQEFVPCSKMTLKEARYDCLGTLYEDWGNISSTTAASGALQTVTSTATATYVLYVKKSLLPNAGKPRDGKNWGVGPTQMKTMQAELRWNTTTLPSGWSVSGNVSFDYMEVSRPGRYDIASPVSVFAKFNQAGIDADQFLRGAISYVWDTNAVHASSSYTDLRAKMDDLLVYDMATPAAIFNRLDTTYALAGSTETGFATIKAAYTVLYAPTVDDNLSTLPTGKLTLKQVATASVSTFQILYSRVPVFAPSEVEVFVKDLAAQAGERIRVVSLFTVTRAHVPKNLYGVGPYAIFRASEKEFDMYPGYVADPSGFCEVNFPSTPTRAARGLFDVKSKAGEAAAAEEAIQELALAVPGAVSDARGLKAGSRILELARRAVASV